MKKLMLALIAGAVAVSACSSDKAPVASSDLVVVKHKANASGTKHRHHKKNASVSASKLGN